MRASAENYATVTQSTSKKCKELKIRERISKIHLKNLAKSDAVVEIGRTALRMDQLSGKNMSGDVRNPQNAFLVASKLADAYHEVITESNHHSLCNVIHWVTDSWRESDKRHFILQLTMNWLLEERYALFRELKASDSQSCK